jgi:hypothetical protein
VSGSARRAFTLMRNEVLRLIVIAILVWALIIAVVLAVR